MRCSFLLTTYNKLETLKPILENFIKNKIPNTEIIVADGFSNDGTVEYLKDLKSKNLIDKIILSEEKDLGEWHGFKKALDVASGEYIKFITDDDAFDYQATEECLRFLELNKNVDWLVTQGYSYQFNQMHYSGYHDMIKNNTCEWRIGEGMCGLTFIIKKSITNDLDLLSGKYGVRTDKQISLELFGSKYAGSTTNILTWVRILNNKSNTILYGSNLENSNIKEVNKNFKIDENDFKSKLNYSLQYLSNNNKNINKDFLTL
jgi:glycosyltransferase involved in cell wall biosynthesis